MNMQEDSLIACKIVWLNSLINCHLWIFKVHFLYQNATKPFQKGFSFLNMWIVEYLLSMTFYCVLWFWSTLFSNNVPIFWWLCIKPFYEISKNPQACSYWGVKVYLILTNTMLISTTVFMITIILMLCWLSKTENSLETIVSGSIHPRRVIVSENQWQDLTKIFSLFSYTILFLFLFSSFSIYLSNK